MQPSHLSKPRPLEENSQSLTSQLRASSCLPCCLHNEAAARLCWLPKAGQLTASQQSWAGGSRGAAGRAGKDAKSRTTRKSLTQGTGSSTCLTQRGFLYLQLHKQQDKGCQSAASGAAPRLYSASSRVINRADPDSYIMACLQYRVP